MWGELSEVYEEWKRPWCVAGNFSIVRYPSTRWGGGRLSM